jgi:hypothetical protein
MRRRFSVLIVLCTWLLASGAHWDLMQSFAWGRMVATYSRTMPLREAVRLTFTADNLCGVCTFVADAKTRAPADSPGVPVAGDPLSKAKLWLAAPPDYPLGIAFVALLAPSWPDKNCRLPAAERAAPPTEPPRAA